MSDIPPLKPSINAWSPEYLEQQYSIWKSSPQSLDQTWQSFFQGFELGSANDGSPSSSPLECQSQDDVIRNVKVNSLVYHYRDIGHLMATLDPLGRERARPDYLRLEAFGLNSSDLDRTFTTSLMGLAGPQKLSRIIEHLERAYCGNLGAEYMHIQNTEERRWLQERFETWKAGSDLPHEMRRQILKKLHQAETFEGTLQKAYPSEKRFSLEGAETLIPILACAIDAAAELGVEEGVLGMAHRGRLNVLANIMGKGYDYIFAEFEGNYVDTYMGGGDVKYHKGYSSDIETLNNHSIYMTLAANPSHLEAVDPVVMGRCRAKQRVRGDVERKRVFPILVHGDAAFAGQGIVAEVLQMVTLPGYMTGGTIHVIVNNQIGFTTDPASARSSVYCTDVAKMVQAPIFHVNGEDPDLCAATVRLAIEYRQKFGKDVVIDMWCYRKYGHNEADNPAYTQPKMYEIISKKKSVRNIYQDRLVAEGVIEVAEGKKMNEAIEAIFAEAIEQGRLRQAKPNQEGFQKKWESLVKNWSFDPINTSVSLDTLIFLAERLADIPESFNPDPKLKRGVIQKRRDAVIKDEGMDWGCAELLAYGSLLNQSIPVRLSGQDSRRGTFSHRHSVLIDIKTEESYTPLNALSPTQAKFCVYDSPLSEVAVLGFEYGYSIAEPQMLFLWEAQFGDFANGAQVIIDQFLASAETKWDRASGLVLLLPHGYEGQGPEHSSARLERFLQLCAEDNMQVVNVTTPAQYFHLVRRQVLRRFRKPLIVMSPKSLLRHPEAISHVKDLTDGSFQEVLDDPFITDQMAVKRILLCTGKVYYDLIARRRETGATDTAIVRLEQIYPLHVTMLEQIIARYPNAKDVKWCQEEPRNMGAWSHINEMLQEKMGLHVGYIGRPAAATPAVGSAKLHKKEVLAIMESALPATPAPSVR